jgi:hypothetical protein
MKHVFSVWSTTEVIICHLEISIITKKKPRQDSSKCNIMLELFFDSPESIHMEFIPGVTVNKHHYKEILRRVCNSICHNHPELCRRKAAVTTRQCPCTLFCACPREVGKTTGHCFATLSILTWSRTIRVLIFPRLRENLCGRQLQSAEEFITPTREAVQDLPANIFQLCFQQLYQCWQTCIVANGNYILREGVDMCKCTWVSCNMVQRNHGPRNYWL